MLCRLLSSQLEFSNGRNGSIGAGHRRCPRHAADRAGHRHFASPDAPRAETRRRTSTPAGRSRSRGCGRSRKGCTFSRSAHRRTGPCSASSPSPRAAANGRRSSCRFARIAHKPLFPAFDELDDRLQGILTRSNKVRSHEGKTGRELYAALSDEAKAGLLNISKKSLATGFRNGGDLLPHLVLIDVLGDRCFVEVPRSLIEQMPQLVDGNSFRSVNGALHDAAGGLLTGGQLQDRRRLRQPAAHLLRERRALPRRRRYRRCRGPGPRVPGGAQPRHRQSDAPVQHPPDPAGASASRSGIPVGAEGVARATGYVLGATCAARATCRHVRRATCDVPARAARATAVPRRLTAEPRRPGAGSSGWETETGARRWRAGRRRAAGSRARRGTAAGETRCATRRPTASSRGA